MQFGLPYLDVLVLPTGATDGVRIEFDGINGEIRFYDSHNHVIGLIAPTAGDDMTLFVLDDSGAFVELFAGDGAAIIALQPPDDASFTFDNARISTENGGGDFGPFLVLGSPTQDTHTDARIFVIGEGDVGRARVTMSAGDDTDIDLVVNDRPIGLGGRRQQVLTNNDAALSASGATDMGLADVTPIDDHTYAIHLHARLQLAGAAVSEWHVNLHVDGTLYDRLATIENPAAATYAYGIDGTVYWTAPDDNAHDFTVEAVEIVSGQTFQLLGTATVRRTLTMTDLGFMELE